MELNESFTNLMTDQPPGYIPPDFGLNLRAAADLYSKGETDTLLGSKADQDATDTAFANVNASLLLKAPLASPALTGTPSAPTPATATNSTQLATTAYVINRISLEYTAADVLAKLLTVDGPGSGLDADLLGGSSYTTYAKLASPAFSGNPTAPSQSAADSSTRIANTQHVTDKIDLAFAVNYTPADILAKLKTVDGAGSGLDTDFFRGLAPSDFATQADLAAAVSDLDAGNITSGTLNDARLSAPLASIAGLTTSADQMIYTTGADAYNTAPLTAFARSILDDDDAASAATTLDMKWLSKGIGELYLVDTSKTGVDIPPSGTSNSTVWVQLTAGLTGSGQFNENKLTSESVSGSAPLVLATAQVSLSGSPMNGAVIDLLNTEGRIVRPSTSAGTKQNDQMQTVTGAFEIRRREGGSNLIGAPSGAFSDGGFSGSTSTAMGPSTDVRSFQIVNFSNATSSGARTGDETRMKNVGVTAYMRIK